MKFWMQVAQNMCSVFFKLEEDEFLYIMDILDCVARESKVRMYMKFYD